MRRRSLVLAVTLGLLLSGGIAAAAVSRRPAVTLRHADGTVVRTGPRVRVQVLNATRTRGLARRAMLYLRDQGFDVVEVGTSGPTRDSTVVIDRSRHPEWAREVAKALGGARIESRPDSSRYLDVTVLLGGAWRPAAEPFHP